ncbi:hypothetical protein DRO69_03275 [Candidatus Bathyarchaeota archaeon]|nr:MAG: hypothetical protein DRO69_03275 [Candidatus Bathyarchaeota archaeon]
MKKIATILFLLVLFITLIMPIHASATMKATINQSIHVVINFENISSPIYNEIKQNKQLFNATTIPLIILNNLKQQKQTRVRWRYTQEIDFDNPTNSIHVEFFLAGSDIITFTFNKTTMSRLYEVQTEWRKFNVDLTENFSINFAEYFRTPIADWTYIKSEKAYYYEYTELDSFTPSCKFILPKTATNINAEEDTIFFETPPLFEDVLLNSPFLILGALLTLIITAFIYRKIRK